MVILVPIIVCIFWIGIYPKAFLSRMETSVEKALNQAKLKYELTKKDNSMDHELSLQNDLDRKKYKEICIEECEQ